MIKLNVYKIFDADLREKLQLINYMCEKGDWLATDKLVEKTTLEKKTMLKYISEIQIALSDFEVPGIEISASKRQGYKLICDSEEVKEKFKLYLTEDTLILKMLKTLFLDDQLNIVSMSIHHFVSESTIRRKLKRITPLFKEFKVSICSKKGAYQLVGEEKNIRELGKYLFWTIYKGNAWPFKGIDQEKILFIIEQMSESYSCFLNRQEKLDVSFFIAICLTRFFHNKKISLNPKHSDLARINERIFQELDIETTLNQLFYLPIHEAEIHFIAMYTQTKTKLYGNTGLLPTLLDAHKKLETPIIKATEAFIDKLIKHFKIDLQDYSEASLSSVYSALFAAHYSAYIDLGINTDHQIQKKYKATHNGLRNKMTELCGQLLTETNNPIFSNPTFLVNRYLMIYAAFHSINTFEPKITILFETAYSVLQEELLRNTIMDTFSPNYNLTVMSLGQQTGGKDLDFDLTISTNFLNDSLITSSSTPTIYLRNKYISKSDAELIHSALEQVHAKKEREKFQF